MDGCAVHNASILFYPLNNFITHQLALFWHTFSNDMHNVPFFMEILTETSKMDIF